MKLQFPYFYAFILVFFASCAFGQEDQAKREFRAKIYSESLMDFDRNKTSAELFKTFSPSISWGREYGNFQEIELKDFKLSFNEFSTLFQTGIEYSYNWRILRRNNESRFNFFIGTGAGSNFGRKSLSLSSSTNANYTSQSINFNLVFIPRMTVNLGKRAFLDVSTPYNYYTYQHNRYNAASLTRPHEDVRGSTTNSAVFPNQFTVKVGVAFKF